MADFEAFGGFDQSDKIDPASFEKFKERVKAASAQIKAIKKEEKKKRKKEDHLIKILLKFVKNHQKRDIMLLIARLLEQNIPPVFILSIVQLGNEELLTDEEGKPLLKEGERTETKEDSKIENHQALSLFDKDKVLPLEIKIAIDDWMKNILEHAQDEASRIVQTAFDPDGNIKLPLIQLSAFILRDFLESKNQEAEYEVLKEFSDYFLNGILKNIKEAAEKQKQLEKKANEKEEE